MSGETGVAVWTGALPVQLKGSTLADVLPELWPMLAFLLVAAVVALARYRQTLD